MQAREDQRYWFCTTEFWQSFHCVGLQACCGALAPAEFCFLSANLVFKTGLRGITREDTGNLGQETLHCTDRYTVFFILHPSNHILHLSKKEKKMQVNKNICAFDEAATWDKNKNTNQSQYVENMIFFNSLKSLFSIKYFFYGKCIL